MFGKSLSSLIPSSRLAGSRLVGLDEETKLVILRTISATRLSTSLKATPISVFSPNRSTSFSCGTVTKTYEQGASLRIPFSANSVRFSKSKGTVTTALVLIQSMHRVNGQRQYVFASPTHPRQTISENALLQRMRRLGITKEMGTPHGFRASTRTLLDEELAYKKDWIEHQLAHKVREPDGRAYNRTEFLSDRKTMMQA
jgi:hypothetical protein